MSVSLLLIALFMGVTCGGFGVFLVYDSFTDRQNRLARSFDRASRFQTFE